MKRVSSSISRDVPQLVKTIKKHLLLQKIIGECKYLIIIVCVSMQNHTFLLQIRYNITKQTHPVLQYSTTVRTVGYHIILFICLLFVRIENTLFHKRKQRPISKKICMECLMLQLRHFDRYRPWTKLRFAFLSFLEMVQRN